ncbi:MAG TPA: alpha/beta hydrolase [Oligoflexus sp.]|uniref:serine aminopeptidase domain-containing protein n=1 Tax=Oligoflexus sp. TaxID=1971216 RepID=UPI002D456659|nr:alpha/beta hydrolase [Oligoflexus sp.]HYX35621.1 alpha/beta hydrolase [Oligoflexus sp.]
MAVAITFLSTGEGSITQYETAPDTQSVKDEGVLFINSGPWDIMRLSWLQKQITAQLSDMGYHVTRFDLCGTGDSPEATESASWERWVRECCAVRDALRKKVRKVHVVGIRLGAALALKASENYAFRSLHLIDPIFDGAAYWENLQKLQQNFLAIQNRFGTQIETTHELLGYPLGPAWKSAIEALNFRQFDGKGRRAYIYGSHALPAQEAFVENLVAKNWEIKSVPVADDFAWLDPIKIHLQCFARATLQSIYQEFAEL